jgi:hypothetical protein
MAVLDKLLQRIDRAGATADMKKNVHGEIIIQTGCKVKKSAAD